MSGQEFEQFVSSLFNELGYETSVTKTSGDQGIDVVATKVRQLLPYKRNAIANLLVTTQ